MENTVQEIKKLKKEKNAVILAHCYQPVEIDEVADFCGDSFYLSKAASKTDADMIVFAGVHFMAQSAKILNPSKKVLLPNLKSGCFMADMVDVNSLKEFKNLHPGIPVVCYINSSAEVKAECDICCTSSNAINVVRSLNVSEVLFVPDAYLGKYVENKLGNVKVHTFNGFCPTHLKVRPEDVINARKNHPEALVLTHPECHGAVTDISDFVGSTKEIMEFAKSSSAKEFIIATEKGVVERLSRDLSVEGKQFFPVKDDIVCTNMKQNSLEDILNSLKNEEHEITVSEEIFEKSRLCLEKMMNVNTAGING